MLGRHKGDLLLKKDFTSACYAVASVEWAVNSADVADAANSQRTVHIVLLISAL